MARGEVPAAVLACDPGKKTGWALWQGDDDAVEYWETNFRESVELMDRYVPEIEGLHVVCESFIITVQTAKDTQAPWSLEGIGCLRRAALLADRPFTLQAPSSAKTFTGNDRLREMNWYRTGMGHANDAHRHLLLYLATHSWWSDRIVI